MTAEAVRHGDNNGDTERLAMLVRLGLAAAVLAFLLLHRAVGEGAVPPRGDVFTVTPVPVDVTAGNAAAARDQAVGEGEQQAFQLLLARLTLAADRGRLPKASVAQLNELVQGFEVAHERRSGVRYLADFAVHFRAEAIRQLLRKAGIGFAETMSKPLVILAVLHDGERTVLWDDPNPWRDAWANIKPPLGLVPLVRPVGELGDV